MTLEQMLKDPGFKEMWDNPHTSEAVKKAAVERLGITGYEPPPPTLREYAAMPADWSRKHLGTPGKVAAAFMPESPEGWAGFGAGTAAMAGGAPLALAAIIAGLGAGGANIAAGGDDPVGAAGVEAGGTILGGLGGKGASAGINYAGRTAAAQKTMERLGDAIYEVIPNLRNMMGKLDPTKFFQVVGEEKYKDAIRASYEESFNEIDKRGIKFLQNPTITQLMNKYKTLRGMPQVGANLQGLQGTPAHLPLGGTTRGTAVSVKDADDALRTLTRQERFWSKSNATDAEAKAEEFARAAKDMKAAIVRELDKQGPPTNRISLLSPSSPKAWSQMGAGEIYENAKFHYARGRRLGDILSKDKDKVFGEGSPVTVDFKELQKSLRMAMPELKRIDAEQVAIEARRRATSGATDTSQRLPFSGWLPGIGHMRMHSGLNIPIPAGANTTTPLIDQALKLLGATMGQRGGESVSNFFGPNYTEIP